MIEQQRPVLKGTRMNAVYTKQKLNQYKDHAFIEALPEVMVAENALASLFQLPAFDPAERDYPQELIYHSITYNLTLIFQPFSRHEDLRLAISAQIRNGYIGRHPFTPDFIKKARKNSIKEMVAYGKAGSFALVGPSGMGKSRVLEIILLSYPQVIYHSVYQRKKTPFTQLVWLKVDCPSFANNTTMKALGVIILETMDSVLGTSYALEAKRRKYNMEEVLNDVGNKCHIHGVGLLCIDEIQRLKYAQEGSAKILEFFVSLVDKVGIPIIFVGTPAASGLFGGAFANARRETGYGDFLWDRMENDNEWKELIETLFDYQWTNINVNYKDYVNLFYELAQGIPDIAVKLYAMAQWDAVRAEKKQSKSDDDNTSDAASPLSPVRVRDVAERCLKLVAPMLKALRDKDVKRISEYSDLSISWADVHNLMKKSPSTDIEQCADGKSTNIKEIAAWLRDAGVANEKAQEAAEQAVAQLGEGNLETAKYHAFDLIVKATKAKGRNKGKLSNKASGQTNSKNKVTRDDASAKSMLSNVAKDELDI
ncbi:MAG: ATP-binding protein [Negativicutes bacterium]|nr:ATP-binding protein [Negativicutes bacterium]